MSRRLTKAIDGKITVNNGEGNSNVFNNDTHFNAHYPTLDLTGKSKLIYELGRSDWAWHVDPSQTINDVRESPTPQDILEMKVQVYEDCIDQAATLEESLSDIYFGVNLATAQGLKKDDLEERSIEYWREKWTDTKIIKNNLSTIKAITAVGLTNPCEITTEENHNWLVGDFVRFPQIEGTVELLGAVVKVGSVVTNKKITLNNVDATGFTAYTDNGYIQGPGNPLLPKTDWETIEDHLKLKKAEVDACLTVACVKAVTPSWPSI